MKVKVKNSVLPKLSNDERIERVLERRGRKKGMSYAVQSPEGITVAVHLEEGQEYEAKKIELTGQMKVTVNKGSFIVMPKDEFNEIFYVLKEEE